MKEAMVNSRHNSVSASLAYQKRDSVSEIAKINALEGLFAKADANKRKKADVINVDSDDEPIIQLKKKKKPAVKKAVKKLKLTKKVNRKVGG